MKRILLSLTFICALSMLAGAQTGKNNHGKVVSTTAHQTTTSSSTTTQTNQTGTGNASVTTHKHMNGKKGKHKGWTRKSRTTTTTKM